MPAFKNQRLDFCAEGNNKKDVSSSTMSKRRYKEDVSQVKL